MSEPFDVYVDQVLIGIGPYGSALTFRRTPSQPPPTGSAPAYIEVGTIRMSNEHLKIMVYLLKRQIENSEENLGMTFPASFRVLNDLKVAPEDWEHFWSKD